MFSATGVFISFASGILGAAFGAATSFSLVGFLVLGGVFIQAASGSGDFLSTISFGVWGPHVGGFAAGVAAAAYAASKGEINGEGKDLNNALMGLNRPDVLLVGGIFGIGGYLINLLVSMPGHWTDTVGLTVVLSGIASRLLFGSSGLFGQVPGHESRFKPKDGLTPLQLALIGLGAGTFSAYAALEVANGAGIPLCFGLAAASLLFGQFGLNVPVTHHIVMPAAVAAAASGSVIWGAIFGVASAILWDIIGNLFNTWGDTHIDPPAFVIFTMTTLSIVFQNNGVYAMLGI
ncbi:permease [Desulfoluna butyratoxydans]|uniref:DUF7973 domain-containing protein n=1 Tax=Desulfoluna butyratoxydans TaxID=231438 RepID=A0A4U8YLX2_9BACT|nr:permease [Desulfoluna butyratoxydans]VFQ44660.1 hypothetical protein MSL71_23090 [Desulfoluna butyratoxydans]